MFVVLMIVKMKQIGEVNFRLYQNQSTNTNTNENESIAKIRKAGAGPSHIYFIYLVTMPGRIKLMELEYTALGLQATVILSDLEKEMYEMLKVLSVTQKKPLELKVNVNNIKLKRKKSKSGIV